MIKHSSIRFVAASTLLSGVFAFAQTPVQTAIDVRRTSDNRDADLIDALVAKQRFDDAETVCRWKLDQHQKTSDQYALATTWLSKVNIAKLIAAGMFDPAAVREANQPIEQLLSEYQALDRRLFLEAAAISVRLAAIQMEVAVAAIDVSEQSETLPAMVRLTRLNRDTESLIEQITKSTPKNDTRLKDQQRLEQELLVATVSMALMQTEMSPNDSSDAIAAATAAIESAELAQQKLPPNSQAANEIQRMRITATLRSGDAKRAMTLIRQLLDESTGLPSSKIRALQIEILLALGRVKEAGERVRANEGSSPNTNHDSIPMDLARLRYFLATDQTNIAANWIIQIGQQHGLYARRLAEGIVLSKLGNLSSDSSDGSPSAALIETQGRQLIREGKLTEGGRLLARAVDSQTEPDRAFEIAIAAASALQKAKQFRAGSIALSNAAKKHSQSPSAASVDLQAIVMLTSGTPPATGDEIEDRLRIHLQTWPVTDVSLTARQWLIQVLVARNKAIDAAVIASSLTRSQINPTTVDAMIEQWKIAFKITEKRDLNRKASAEAQTSFARLGKHPLVIAAHRKLAACYLDRSALQFMHDDAAVEDESEPPWVEQVLEFRRSGELNPDLRNLTQNVGEIRRRLMRDGESNRAIRARIADLLTSWPSASSSATDKATIQLWLGNVTEAIAIIESSLKTNDQSKSLIRAATLFQDFESKEAKIAAIGWWDRLAAGSEVGSPVWHRGKLAAIDLLFNSGQKVEASRRAKYILLTTADLTSQQKSKYQSYQP